MTQNVVDFSDNPTGAELMDDYLFKEQENNLSSNSGIQRPSYAVAGTKWLDTSVTPWLWKMYDGTNDVALGTVNPSTHLFTPAGVLPSQEDQSGKFLQTNGTNTLWASAQLTSNLEQSLSQSTTKYPSSKAVQDAVNSKVGLTGNETIYGYKTFRNDNSMAKVFIQGNLGLSENPAISGGQAQLEFHDKNGEWEGIVGIERYTSGKRILKLQLKDQDDAQNRIELIRNENGVWYATCPTPPTTNNDKAIATTAWVRQVAALKDLSNVSSNIDYIIEQGGNRYQWYRIYKSGRLEQGGIYDNETNVSNIRKQITLLKPYQHQSYNITVTPMSDGCRGTVCGRIVSRTTLELQYTGDYGVIGGTVNCRYLSWKTDDAKGN